MKRVPVVHLGTLALGFLALCFTLFGFVPSCEKELATLYPGALKADLSVCSLPRPAIKATAAADVAKFARRLNGTWELKMRTVQGITVDTNQLSANMYFDLTPMSTSQVTGAALLLERPKDTPLLHVSEPKNLALGFWDVAVDQKSKMSLRLAMTEGGGSKLPGSIAHAVRGAEFAELNSVFVALDAQSPKSEVWDRIMISDFTMVYVSCQRGVIEHYAKTSGQKPVVDGLPVKTFWAKQEAARLKASLSLPGFRR
jgi:hypothetical protein